MKMLFYLFLSVIGLSSATPALAILFLSGEGGYSDGAGIREEEYKASLFNPPSVGKYSSKSGTGSGRLALGYVSSEGSAGIPGLSFSKSSPIFKTLQLGLELGVGYYSYTALTFDATDGFDYNFRQDTSGIDLLAAIGWKFGEKFFAGLKFGINNLRMVSKANSPLSDIEGGESLNTAITKVTPMFGLLMGQGLGKGQRLIMTFSAYHMPGKKTDFGTTEQGATPAIVGADLKIPSISVALLGLKFQFKK